MSVERGKLVTIHGIDGTGKTTVAREVERELAARAIPVINYDDYKSTKENPIASKKDVADKHGSLEERLAAHLESTSYHSSEIDGLLAKGFHVVKSRYLDDVMAHFVHLGVPQEKLDEMIGRFPIIQPDLKVILTVDESVRAKRVRERPDATVQDMDTKVGGSRAQFFEDYVRRVLQESGGKAFLELDTSSQSARDVSKIIVDGILTKV